jgi:hypothetical protein
MDCERVCYDRFWPFAALQINRFLLDRTAAIGGSRRFAFIFSGVTSWL